MNFKEENEPTYYVIEKYAKIVNADGETRLGAGPFEVTTDEQLARDHLAVLNENKHKIVESFIKMNKNVKDFSIDYDLVVIDQESNEKAAVIIDMLTEE